jgi:hypothetical protein
MLTTAIIRPGFRSSESTRVAPLRASGFGRWHPNLAGDVHVELVQHLRAENAGAFDPQAAEQIPGDFPPATCVDVMCEDQRAIRHG